MAVFLIFMLWRMIDFAIYKWDIKNGHYVYTTTEDVELYPLESTFPEIVPMFVCFFFYRKSLEKDNPTSSSSNSNLESNQHVTVTMETYSSNQIVPE